MQERLVAWCPKCGAPSYLNNDTEHFECSNLEACGYSWEPKARTVAMRRLAQRRPKWSMHGPLF